MRRYVGPCAALSLLFAQPAGCSPGARTPVSKGDALRTADAFVLAHFPRPSLSLYARRATDHGRSWIVVYQLPDTYAGGGRTIEIDKASGTVVKASLPNETLS
jgi:hypothetical protein